MKSASAYKDLYLPISKRGSSLKSLNAFSKSKTFIPKMSKLFLSVGGQESLIMSKLPLMGGRGWVVPSFAGLFLTASFNYLHITTFCTTLTLWRSTVFMMEPWKKVTVVKCLFISPSSSSPGGVLAAARSARLASVAYWHSIEVKCTTVMKKSSEKSKKLFIYKGYIFGGG